MLIFCSSFNFATLNQFLLRKRCNLRRIDNFTRNQSIGIQMAHIFILRTLLHVFRLPRSFLILPKAIWRDDHGVNIVPPLPGSPLLWSKPQLANLWGTRYPSCWTNYQPFAMSCSDRHMAAFIQIAVQLSKGADDSRCNMWFPAPPFGALWLATAGMGSTQFHFMRSPQDQRSFGCYCLQQFFGGLWVVWVTKWQTTQHNRSMHNFAPRWLQNWTTSTDVYNLINNSWNKYTCCYWL